ncbi:ComEA family DNA-binding protein [Paraburkholderia flagellata]|uniref:ComEA family DNA-binding protein n=1 Tax=Paraburkholderia flagellata TaxID=2883241 RepID=UPI001F475DFF|nr:helix-hairpin-helix domain-containing protein [Paraburkholderia flagellata]
MLKKLLMLFLAIGLSLSAVLAAAVEVNTADETALESVKGIGPVHAKAIIDERTKNGPFKDADDLVSRVKGIGPKSVQNLEAAGLTINGSSAPPAGKTASAKSGKSAAPAATTANPMTAQTPAAATTAQAASDTAAGTSKHKSKKDKAAAAASAPDAGSAAAAPASASDTKAKKTKKSKKDKAASAAAASGA